MKINYYSILAWATLCFLISTVSQRSNASETIDQQRMVKEAMLGNADAALKLANASIKRSHNAMVYWYRIAAENGSAIGQYNYGTFLVADSKGKSDCMRALFWFRKAAKQGDKYSLDYIKPLESKLESEELKNGCANVI